MLGAPYPRNLSTPERLHVNTPTREGIATKNVRSFARSIQFLPVFIFSV